MVLWSAATVPELAIPCAVAGQAGPVIGMVREKGTPASKVVVYLEPDQPGPVGPSTPSAPVIDQSHLRFVPDVIVVRPGTTVNFLNSDPILHNVFSPGWAGEKFDLGTYPSGSSRSHTFTRPGPHVILCHVHPEMAAYVFVVDTPYEDLTDADGRFRIDRVPPGGYVLHVWQRGAAPREARMAVPAGGTRGLVVDLSGGGTLLVSTGGG